MTRGIRQRRLQRRPGEGIVERSAVLERARIAASAVKPSYEVLVTESAGRSWYKLKPV
jgi:hypothetical protein